MSSTCRPGDRMKLGGELALLGKLGVVE